jgi:hypothetical protein
MNWEALTFVVIALGFLKDGALVLWVAPLRRVKEKMETYVQEHMREKSSGHEKTLIDHEGRIRGLELDQVAAGSHARKIFLTRQEFRDVDEKRDRQWGLMNDKADAQRDQLTRIQTLLEERTGQR